MDPQPMTQTDTKPQPLTLWLTDRSRVEAGLDHCPRDRYLRYHAGPHGYGWQRRAQSIPTVTGTLIHEPITDVLTHLLATDAIPSDVAIYTAITRGRDSYLKIVDDRGLRQILSPEDLDRRVNEQLTLMEGLIWTWCRVILPAFHQTYRVVSVEQEGVTVLGCTCGLGDRIPPAEDHDARGCQGIGWMSRGDAIAQHRLSGSYSYHDLKTMGDLTPNTEAQWYHRIQLLAGVLGEESRLGVVIDEVYLHCLFKGRYQSEYSQETKSYSGPKFQNSPLVYAYHHPGNPPLVLPQWAAKHSYLDALGKARKLSKDFQRTPIWTMPEEEWRKGDPLSVSDYWTRWLHGSGILGEQARVLGPIYRSDWKLEQFQVQLLAEEHRWADRLWRLHSFAQDAGIEDWADPGYQRSLDNLIPQARGTACASFFGDECEFLGLCNREAGWEDPALMGLIPRRPHHTPELDQAVSRGLLPMVEGLTEEGE